MSKIVKNVKEIINEVKTGISIYLLARRYSRRNKGITTKSLLETYGKD